MNRSKYFAVESGRLARAFDVLKGKKVAVIGHLRPDGDCIGSTVAVVRLLNGMGIEAVGLNGDAVPEKFQTFLGDTPFFRADSFQPDGHLAVTVDSADRKRIGDRLNEYFPEIALNIDHHISNKPYALENIVVDSASATAEILAGCYLDNGYDFDPYIAQGLYLGIATDTGQFRFPSTSPATFEIAHRLCLHGARPAEAAFRLYENESFAKIRLLQAFLASLRMESDGRVCIGVIENGVHQACGSRTDDSEGLVDYARSIKGVRIGVLLEERDGSVKGSLRSKDPFYRVDELAQRFGGGGHACAAGLNVEGVSVSCFLPELIESLEKHLQNLGKPDS